MINVYFSWHYINALKRTRKKKCISSKKITGPVFRKLLVTAHNFCFACGRQVR